MKHLLTLAVIALATNTSAVATPTDRPPLHGAIPMAAVAATCPTAPPIPCFDHVFIVVMENHSYDEIVGSAEAPFFNELAAAGTLFGNYFAVGHPSLPNYIALTSADAPAYPDCDPVPGCTLSGPSLADTVEASGRTWKGYLESMGAGCGTADSGSYAVRHDPWVYYDNIRTNPARCNSHVVDYSQLAIDLASAGTIPNLVWITPNLCNDMHDCSIGSGDTWMREQIPLIVFSPAFTSQNSLLVVVWDEDDDTQGNQVPLLMLGNKVQSGLVSGSAYDHYSLVRTLEVAWGLPALTANDAGATPITNVYISASWGS